MLRLSKLETRTQEILLWLSAVGSLFVLVGCVLFLKLEARTAAGILGQSGLLAFRRLFHEFGYGALLSVWMVWSLGNFVVERSQNWQDVGRLWKKILLHTMLNFFLILMAASVCTILQIYFRFTVDPRLMAGAGGGAGQVIGGELFLHLGLFGSLMALGSLSVITGIASGQLELVSLLLFFAEWAKYAAKETKFALKRLYDFILVKIGINEEQLADAMIDFDAATGHYVTVHQAPKFTHHFVEREIQSEYQKEKLIELPSEGAVRPRAAAPKSGSELVEQAKEAAAPAAPKRARAKKNSDSEKTEKTENEELPQGEDQPANASAETAGGETADLQVKAYTKRYSKPDIELLRSPVKHKEPKKSEVEEQSRDLEARLASFKLPGKVVDVHNGCRLTLYEFMPEAGVKLSKIASLSNDLALLLGADSLRMMTPIPGKTTVGIEVPSANPSPINFSELVKGVEKFAKEKPLPIAMGMNVYNKVVTADIATMPHLLISGTTGSGKSVFMNTLITSLLYTRSPKELRFIMVDPKMIELSPYNGIPHLLRPVVTDVNEAKDTLQWAEREMDRRYKIFGDTGSRNIVSFNEMIEKGNQASSERKAGKKFDWEWAEMPYIVVIIDELADLMITQGKEVEIPITRIAQKARACGIHMVIATQRPSAEIVTGLIKTNFPTRIAFKVSSAIDSRTILDTAGAEKLLGNGDMLYMPNGKAIERIQASFLSEDEVKKIVRAISGS